MAAAMTDDELAVLVERLNQFEAADVHEALSQIDARAIGGRSAGPSDAVAASGALPFGSASPGIFVGRLDSDRYRLRITASEITGAVYDEFELPADGLRALVDALVGALRGHGASEAP